MACSAQGPIHLRGAWHGDVLERDPSWREMDRTAGLGDALTKGRLGTKRAANRQVVKVVSQCQIRERLNMNQNTTCGVAIVLSFNRITQGLIDVRDSYCAHIITHGSPITSQVLYH